ncbi:MAG: NmrA family NAD(P)-binding protein [Thermoguttaceae bacterium]
MKIAVTTPSGHVGSSVADFLLDFGRDVQVKLLGRRPEKLQDFVRRGAEMAVGVQEDADYLVSATQGVDALFWTTPPAFGSDNVRSFQHRLGQAAATAIRANKIPRVVNVSSIGADLESGAGPISGLHDVEELINQVGCHVTHLRPGFFFENLLMQIDTIRTWGRVSLPITGSFAYPMIATRDIGRVAAGRLINTNWKGRVVQELHGPVDLSFREMADVLSQVLDRKIVYVKADPRDFREELVKKGLSENVADSLLEMYGAMESGQIRTTQPRTPETTTPTTLAEFAREVIVPLIAQPVGAGR